MKNTPSWQSRGLFLSSTFLDMHTERDALRLHVFPELAERLLPRRHHLDVIDLRQGIDVTDTTDQAAREMRILRVCLEEIERTRPFFIGLLGDRYGWVPPAERLAAAVRNAGLTGIAPGLSVTELEIRHGVLESADQRSRSWFYLRELDTAGMPLATRARFDERATGEPGTEERWQRLQELKRRLREALPDRVRTYHARWDAAAGRVTGLEELAAMVREDLWRDLDEATRAFQVAVPQSWQEADRWELEQFTASRLRSFLERPNVTDPLLRFATGKDDSPWAQCVTGEAGSGKSTVFAALWRELVRREDVLVLAAAAGSGEGSSQVDRLLRRWIGELAAALGLEDPLPELERTPDTEAASLFDRERAEASSRPLSERLEEAFTGLLHQAAERRRVVVLLDALDQMEDTTRARQLTWLPPAWPANARLVATAIPGTASAALLRRDGAREFPLPPLARDEARELADRHARIRYHHDVDPAALNSLLDKKADGHPAHANPLWLQLAVTELNLMESDDFALADREFGHLPGAERLSALLQRVAGELPADVPGAYARLLNRAEREVGAGFTRAVLDAVALSRHGWRDQDLQALVPVLAGEPWDDLRFADLRRILGGHLARRGELGQWDCFHAQMRTAILDRDLPDMSRRRALHGRLADHLLSLPAGDPLRDRETMVHLLGQAEPARVVGYLAELRNGTEERQGAVETLARALETGRGMLGGVAPVPWLLDAMERSALPPDRFDRPAELLLFDLDVRLRATARHEDIRQSLLEGLAKLLAGRDTKSNSTERTTRNLSVSYNKLGDLHRGLGHGEKALEFYQKALEIREELHRRNPQSADVARGLSISYNKLGDLHGGLGQGEKALAFYQMALEMAEELHRSNPQSADAARDLAVCYIKLGDVHGGFGQGEKALTFYQKALEIAEELHRRNPQSADVTRVLAVSYERIGDLHHEIGQLEKAFAFYQKALTIAEELHRRNPQSADVARDLSVRYCRLGDLHGELEQGEKALGFYQKALEIAEELHRRNPQSADVAKELALLETHVFVTLGIMSNPFAALHLLRALSLLEELEREGRLPDQQAAQALAQLREWKRQLG